MPPAVTPLMMQVVSTTTQTVSHPSAFGLTHPASNECDDACMTRLAPNGECFLAILNPLACDTHGCTIATPNKDHRTYDMRNDPRQITTALCCAACNIKHKELCFSEWPQSKPLFTRMCKHATQVSRSHCAAQQELYEEPDDEELPFYESHNECGLYEKHSLSIARLLSR